MRTATIAEMSLLIALPLPAAAAETALPVIELRVASHRIEAEIASTDRLRTSGLMNRPVLPVNRGMLFVFAEKQAHCMWMKNTPLPLSAAFLDDDGVVLGIEEMDPEAETYHCAAQEIRYVLEMNGGWFKGREIGPGARINGVEKAPTGQ